MKTKRLISILLAVVMMLQTISFAALQKDFDDFPKKSYWSYEAMENALKVGLLKGRGNGLIAPKDNLTRAEFAAVVTRAFGATVTKNIDFLTDVKKGDWFYDDNSVSKAYQMQVMNGTSENTFNPNDNMRREDVFLTLARALFVSGEDDEILNKFEDKNDIDSWPREALIGMVSEGYVNGYKNDETGAWTLKPRDSITREELAQVFYNLFKHYISAKDVTEENKGVFGGETDDERVVYDGSLIVKTPDVTLRNAVIDGDLIIADGVGNGDFTLKNVEVKGNIVFRGGEGTVTFTNVTASGKVIINDVNGTVNFHNYRTDEPFNNNTVENTPATFLTKSTTGGGGGGGGGGSSASKVKYYRVEHYFESLENPGEYEIDADKTKEIKSKYGETVEAEILEVEGFEKVDNDDQKLSGTVPKSGKLTLKVYYARKLFDVNFYDKAFSEDPVSTVKVRYGTRADDEENVEKFKSASTSPEVEDYTFEYEREAETGFYRDEAFGNVYAGKNKEYHEIPRYWWYEDEDGEFVKFNNSEFVFTESVDVYSKTKKIIIHVEKDGLDYEGYYYTPYDTDTRFLDTAKDMIFRNKGSITAGVEYSGIEDKSYEKLAGYGIMYKDGDEYQISNINKFIRFSQLMGEEAFSKFLESFYTDDAVEQLEQYLLNYIKNPPTDDGVDNVVPNLKKLVEALIEEDEDVATELFDGIAKKIISENPDYIEEFLKEYAQTAVDNEDTEELEGIICDVLESFKSKNGEKCVDFITGVIVDAFGEESVNENILKVIGEYINSEIKNGTFNDEIAEYISSLSDEEFKGSLKAVVKADLKNMLSTESDLRGFAVKAVLSSDDGDVKGEIKKYIKNYNLIDDYITEQPEDMLGMLTNAEIAEIIGVDETDISGITTEQLISAISEYLEENGIDALKEKIGEEKINSLIDKYISDYADDAEAAITELLSDAENEDLREEFAAYLNNLVNNEENDAYKNFFDDQIEAYLGEILKTEEGKTAFIEDKVVPKLTNSEIYELDFVKNMIDDVVEDIVSDIRDNGKDSEYVGYITAYVNCVDDYGTVVNALLYSGNSFRDDVISSLFDNLDVVDEDRTIITAAVKKLTDGMVESGTVDVSIVGTMVNFIRHDEENGGALAELIVENLLKIENIIDFAEENLGWIDETEGQLQAVLKFRKEATYNDQFEVTSDNLFIMELVRAKVAGMSFDDFIDEFVAAEIPGDVLEKLPVDIVEDIYDNAIEEFLTALDKAVKEAEANRESSWVNSGVVVRANPIDDILEPLTEWINDCFEKANDKAESDDGRLGKLYKALYTDNDYIDDVLELTKYAKYIKGEGVSPKESDGSGYSVRSFSDIYENVIMPLSVLTDDMFVDYIGKVDFETFEGFAKDNKALLMAMYNHPNELMKRYAKEGLPENLEDYYDDLMEDDEIRKAFEKLENKTSFEMEPLVLKFLTASTVEMYYYKILDRFGVKIDEILDKYSDSEAKKTVTSEDFDKILEELEYCWKDQNKNATTDYVFDGGLNNFFTIFDVSKSFAGFTISVERVME